MRVVLADDSMLIREGVARLLVTHGVDVVGSVGEASHLGDLVAAVNPDVVILDVRMPPTYTDEGIDAALRLRNDHPGLGVVVLSQYVETAWAMKLMENGVGGIGYLLKDRVTKVDEILDAVRRVAGGGSVVDPIVVERLVARTRVVDPLGDLTDREKEVLRLMAEGRSNIAIADTLYLGVKTVETHVRHILLKLGIPESTSDNRRVLAVLAYLRDQSFDGDHPHSPE